MHINRAIIEQEEAVILISWDVPVLAESKGSNMTAQKHLLPPPTPPPEVLYRSKGQGIWALKMGKGNIDACGFTNDALTDSDDAKNSTSSWAPLNKLVGASATQ